MSGGYAGAKRTQMFLCHYLQRTADARDLGIRFVTLAPRQFLVGTVIGEAAVAAYGAEAGVSGEAYMRRRFPDPLDADDVARAIVAIATDEDHHACTVFDLTAAGLVPAG